MKNKTINWVGKQILENSDELEEGCVEIVINVDDILDEIDDEDIEDYAKWNLDMKHEDDFESSLEDFDEDELVEALEDRGYNFSKQIGEDECIEFLEDSGYIVTAKEDVVGDDLDCIDARRLEEIQEKFINGSWDERITLYNKIFNI